MSRVSVMFATVPQPTEAVVPSVPGPKIALPPLLAFWNDGALPAPLLVRTWPAVVPADELRTPVPLLSTTPAPSGVNVIVPAETVSPFDAVRRPLTPSVLLNVAAPVTPSVPATVALPRSACVVLAAPMFTPLELAPRLSACDAPVSIVKAADAGPLM